MEKVKVLFLGIKGFEAFALASLPALQSESPRHIKDQNISAREEPEDALRNEVKCRRISLTRISIYWISFA